jgi:Holliday junction resolvase RusA-like endonuclease
MTARQFLDFIRENHFLDVSNFVRDHGETDLYELEIHFTFPTVVNKGWYKKRAKTLYKKFDVGNRRKLIEDCLVEALGSIDDSLFFRLVLTKSQGPAEGVRMILRSADPKDYGVLNVSRAE